MYQIDPKFACIALKTSNPKQKIIDNVIWKAPQPLWHKLNTDGSALGCLGLAGGGGLLRDHHGKWTKGFCRAIGWANSLYAELWVIRDGLSLSIQLQILEIEIELNAKSMVDLLNSNTTSLTDYAPLVDDYRNLMNQIPRWKLKHCFRETNAYADQLARIVVHLQQSFVILNTPLVESFSLFLI